MYVKRVQLVNCGPIEQLDVTFSLNTNNPKPTVFVGENGSGKTILLSHIVNGLVSAQCAAFPETPEVEVGKVYKLRSPLYIRSGSEYSFAKVDFDNDLYTGEICLNSTKEDYSNSTLKDLLSKDALELWNSMSNQDHNYIKSNIEVSMEKKIQEIFSTNCVLYFPSNRFEEPAWLNELNLKSKATYMELKNIRGYTDRKVINHSPLHDIRNWLFDLAYDRAAFEIQTTQIGNLATLNANKTYTPLPSGVPLFSGYKGPATDTYNTALEVIRRALRLSSNSRLGIGQRANRVVSIVENEQTLVPNLFQLSSGEVSLLTLFLSILRDSDLSGASIERSSDIQGIVVVDEIDLRLHSIHQHEILPRLMQMFSNVQFVVTSHSPLFILGLREFFGDDGFDLYRLPSGQRISAEEFSEFGEAYETFKKTSVYRMDIRTAVEDTQKPIVFVDGTTDIKYFKKASELLDCREAIANIDIRDGEGDTNLKKTWKALTTLPAFRNMDQKIVILHDCDSDIEDEDGEHIFKRKISLIEDNPIKRGIENLFSRETIEKAKEHKAAFIDIDPSRTKMERGKKIDVEESWTVNENEKTNLCNWLCENGTEKDFQNFKKVFEILREIPGLFPKK